jgi:major membrane immunogen (membrane-anchored lipoprotein)
MSISALRRTRWVFSVMVVAVFSALLLVGCGKDDDGDDEKKVQDTGNDKALIGEWVSEDDPDMVVKFTATKMTMTYEGETVDEGSYTTSGGKITTVNEDGEKEVIEYSIKDGKLTVKFEDEDGVATMVFVKKK